jgi:hypothetical protein
VVELVEVSPPATRAPPPAAAAAAAAAAAPTPAAEMPVVTPSDVVLAPAEPGRPLRGTECRIVCCPLVTGSRVAVAAGDSLVVFLQEGSEALEDECRGTVVRLHNYECEGKGPP